MSTEVMTPGAPHAAPVFDFDRVGPGAAGPDVVVVMDDDPTTRAYIVDALQMIGLKPRTVESEEEAVALAVAGKARYFILDAYMGEADRAQEGLAALARIKKHDEKIFVAVYSNHRGLLAKANKLSADVTRSKSGDHLRDIVTIVERLAPPHLKGMVGKLWELLGHTSENPEPVPRDRPPHEAGETDLNKRKYRELRADPVWLKSRLGRHVAFVDGELRDEDEDRGRLLGRVRKAYHDKPVFVVEVKEREEAVRIFSPLRFQHS